MHPDTPSPLKPHPLSSLQSALQGGTGGSRPAAASVASGTSVGAGASAGAGAARADKKTKTVRRTVLRKVA